VSTVLAWSVSMAFGAWFALSVAAQFSDDVHARVPRLSSLGLVPSWTFFAPRPGVDDVHLLYRDRREDGSIGVPAYVPTIEDRRWHHGFWNPGKYGNKVFTDLTSALRAQLRLVRQDDLDLRVIMLSTPYLVMVHLVMAMPRPPDAVARQFLLANTTSLRADPRREIVFVSEFHAFPGIRARGCP
jgi:hypothetical protein